MSNPYAHRVQPFRRRLLQVAVASCFATAVHANPVGPSVVSGAATFNAVGKNLTVTNSPGAIINWQGFSIRPSEVTRFVQSGTASAVLNRVTGPEHSAILGQLLSNGRVFLINPNGVTVGAGARIDTAGFVASSLNLSNEDFLAGKFRFTDSGSAGRVTNAGTINAHSGGSVYLVAPTVENHGVITAPNGDVMLAAGKSVELVSTASPDIRVQIQAGGEVLNVGQLVAESGRVGIFGAAIRNAGAVIADSATVNSAGNIVLKATHGVTLDATSVVSANGSKGGAVTVQAEGGTLLADGKVEAKGAQSIGGTVKLLGEQVGLVGQARIDASGAAGGGTVLAGGDYQGKNPEVQNAKASYVGADATVTVDATQAGDGGKAIVWADGATRFLGTASARGGASAGDGGFVEVSGKDWLAFTGRVDTSAPAGRTGTLLLDPTNITISTAATSFGTCPPAGPCFTLTGNPATANLNVTDLLNALTNTNVAVNTSSTAGSPGDITVSNAVTYAGAAARTLTLTANRNVNINQAVSSTGGALGLTISAGTGAVNFGATGSIATNGGAVSITSATGGGLRGINFGAGGLTLNSAGNFTQASGVLAGSGTVTKNGAGGLTLSRANTYTGATVVNAGTVTVANATGLGTAAAGTTVNAGATLAMNGLTVAGEALTLNGGTLSRAAGNPNWNGTVNLAATSTVTGVAGTLTLGGVVSGAGGLTKTGAGTVRLSGNNTYAGVTTVNAGTLIVNNANALGTAAGGTTVNAGATLALNNFTVAAEPLTLNGGTLSRAAGNPTWNGTVNLAAATSTITGGGGTLTIGGAVSGAGGITKTGAATLVLSASNTYGGPTAINAGTLRVAGGNGIGDTSAVTLANVGSAVLNLNGTSETIGSLAGGGAAGGNVTLGAGTLTTGGDDTSTTYSGVISGTGGLAKNGTGTLTLARANTYTGATTVNTGTLTAANAAALGTVAGGTTVNAGATLNVNGVAIGAEAVTLNGAGIGGAGALQGTGAASLAGPVTLASGSTIGAGVGATLALNGAVNGAAALDLVGGGTIALGNTLGNATPLASLTQSAATTLNINGGLVSTTGAQTYNGPVAIGAPTTLQTAGGSITANGAVTATAATLNLAAGAGDVTMTNGGNDFGMVQVTSGANVNLVDANALVLGVSNVGTIRAQTLAGDLTVNGVIAAAGSGDSIVLAAAGNFVNTAGAAVLNPGAGRWIVYSTTPGGNTFGGLASGNQAIWNTAYPTAIAQPGNRYVFSTQPTATFTSTDAAKTYGDDATAAIAGNFTASGFVDAAAFGGVFTQDTAGSAFTGAPSVTSAGAPPPANVAIYPITVAAGTLAPMTGYAAAFNSAGQLTIVPAPLAIAADDKTKAVGQPNPPFTATSTGFKLGQTVADLTGTLAFTTPATTGSPSGTYPITPGSVSSTNYAITFVDGQLVVTAGPTPPSALGGVATADDAFITATQRSENSPTERLQPASFVRSIDCLVLDLPAGRLVLNRCF